MNKSELDAAWDDLARKYGGRAWQNDYGGYCIGFNRVLSFDEIEALTSKSKELLYVGSRTAQ